MYIHFDGKYSQLAGNIQEIFCFAPEFEENHQNRPEWKKNLNPLPMRLAQMGAQLRSPLQPHDMTVLLCWAKGFTGRGELN